MSDQDASPPAAERVFSLPDLGEGLEDAEIVEWKVSVGDEVELNQPLVEVNTAKALVEIPSPVTGVVTGIHGEPGDVVKVGTPLVTFGVPAGATPTEPSEDAGAEEARREAVLVGYGVDQGTRSNRRRRLRPPGSREEPSAGTKAAPTSGRVRASPPVRRLARKQGLDLSSVRGSGPEGRITRDDVLQAASSREAGGSPGGAQAARPGGQEQEATTIRAAKAPEGEAAGPPVGGELRVPVRGVRRLIAQKMTRSWTEVPHVTTFHTVDATQVEALRRELTADQGVKVSALSVVARALVEVCREHPKLNASFDAEAGEVVLKGMYHVGIATDTERGLLVPVVRDVGAKGILELAREVGELVAAAREGTASPEQLTGSTITVTNFGVFGSLAGTPIINYPESAILGMGRIEPRPLVVDGVVEARPAMTLSLSFDHRALDGADADRAMTALRNILESPFRLGALPR
jgi:2-oxoisovalerate dehydrogenase E2 component (dihydrolipoyl transacylase)